MKDNLRFMSWSILIILALVWGSSFILIKKGLEVFPPDQVGALRIIMAGLFLLPIGLKSIPKLKKRDIPWLLSVGFVGSFIPAFLFATAQTQISSSLAGILNALTPLFVGLIGVILFQQSIKKMVLLGLILGFAGCFLLITNGQFSPDQMNIYGLFVVGATVCYGFNVNIIKFSLANLKAVTITSVSLMLVLPLGLTYLLLFTPFVETMKTAEGAWPAFTMISLLGIVGTSLALILFNRLVQLTNPIFTSSVTYIIPIVAVVWGLLDNETVTVLDGVGFLIIIISVYLINRFNRKT